MLVAAATAEVAAVAADAPRVEVMAAVEAADPPALRAPAIRSQATAEPQVRLEGMVTW